MRDLRQTEKGALVGTASLHCLSMQQYSNSRCESIPMYGNFEGMVHYQLVGVGHGFFVQNVPAC